MSAGEIKVVMTLDDRDFTVKTVKAGQTLSEFKQQAKQVDQASNSLSNSMGGLGTKFKDLVFAVSILRFAFKDLHDVVFALPIAFLKAGGEMERMTKLMEGLSKETDELKKRAEAISSVNFIFNFAKNSPFELKTLTDTFVKLKTAGIEPANGAMLALTNSVAKFGGTSESLKRASIAIQQMAGKGVVSMEELRQQLGEAVPNAMQLMAAGMGMSMAQLTKAVSKGTVEANSALSKMFVQMEIEAGGAAKKMMTTLPGMFNQLKTEFELFKITAADGGMMDAVKDQLQLLTNFFRSPDGKKFAEDTGKAFKILTDVLIVLKDVAIDLIPIVKVLGGAWLFYFGGQTLKNGIMNVTQAFREQKAEALAAAKAPLLVEKQMLEAQKAKIEQKIRLEQEAWVKGSALAEKANAKAITAAEKELNAAQNLYKQRLDDANLATKRAGVLYSEAVKYERAIDAIDASGKGRQGVKRENYKQNMLAYREETVALQQKAVALRNEAQSHYDAAERKVVDLKNLGAAGARLQYQESMTAQGQLANQAINRQAVVDIQRLITAKEQLIVTAGKAAFAIKAFGMAVVSATLWSLGITAVLTGIAWAYDKITASSRQAGEEMRRTQRIEDNNATKDDVKSRTKELEQLERDRQSLQAEVDAYDKSRQRSNPTGGPDTNTPAYQKLQVTLNRIEKIKSDLASAKADVARGQAESDSSNAISTFQSIVEDRLLRSEAQKAALKSEQGLSGLEGTELKKALAQHLANTRAYLVEKLRITQEVFREKLPEVKLKGAAAEAAFTKAYISQQSELAKTLATNGKNVIIGAGGTGADKKENKLLKMIEDEKAKLNIAKVELSLLAKDVRDIGTNAENKAAFEVLAKLAKGDFDYGTDQNPGQEPAKAERLKFIQQLSQYLREGKGSALDFLNGLKGLDGAAQNTTQSWKKMIVEYVRVAAELKRNENAVKAETFAFEQNAKITEELASLSGDLGESMRLMPEPVQAAARAWNAQAISLGLAGEELKKFKALEGQFLANTLLVDLKKKNVKDIRKEQDAQISLIVNVQQREMEQHRVNLARIEEERKAQAALNSVANKPNMGERIEGAGQIEAAAASAIAAETARYTKASKTQLQGLSESWSNVYGNLDQVITSHTQKWMDQLVEFASTGKFHFGDMVASFAKDLLKIQLQQQFAGAVSGLDGALKGAFGLATGTGAGGMPLNAARNAVLVENVNGVLGAVGAATQDGPKQIVEGFFEKVKSGFSSVYDSLAQNMSGFMSFLGDVWTSLVSAISSAMASASASTTASSSGGWASLFASFFADGGVMSNSGSMPLKKYKNGGVANSAQVAVYGEGDMNEAYVPLPDGRSIPVTMSGGGSSAPNVTVNVINQSGQQVQGEQKGQPRFDGKQMILDVVLSAARQPGPFRDGMRQMAQN